MSNGPGKTAHGHVGLLHAARGYVSVSWVIIEFVRLILVLVAHRSPPAIQQFTRVKDMENLPSTNKVTESDADDRCWYVSSAMQGWREEMEDEHTTILQLDDGSEEKNAFFAVYDGHCGHGTSEFAVKALHKRLMGEEAYGSKRFNDALKEAFLHTDKDLRKVPECKWSGSTALVALLTHDGKIYVANAGDSRAVLCAKGEAKELSTDHKPNNPDEKARIKKAGGYVRWGRTNDHLTVSRSLGDFVLKTQKRLPAEEQIITADPEITCWNISEEDEFLVLACDGIWECLRSQDVVDFIRREVSRGVALFDIPGLMFDYLLHPDTIQEGFCCKKERPGHIGRDNMTMIIVALLHGQTKDEWCEWIKDRVGSGDGYPTASGPPELYPQALGGFQQVAEE